VNYPDSLIVGWSWLWHWLIIINNNNIFHINHDCMDWCCLPIMIWALKNCCVIIVRWCTGDNDDNAEQCTTLWCYKIIIMLDCSRLFNIYVHIYPPVTVQWWNLGFNKYKWWQLYHKAKSYTKIIMNMYNCISYLINK